MKALVYHGPGEFRWEEKPQPVLMEQTEAIVQITRTTICGTDLHILKGDVPSVAKGRTLGHEGIGVIVKAGSAVANFKVGDRVLISCITSCGRCERCRTGHPAHCDTWLPDNLLGGQRSDGTSTLYRGESGIAGLMVLPDTSIPPHWQPYVAVDDVDATAAKAAELGGAGLMEPMDVPEVGRIAVLRDPQGATFGIIKPQPAS